MSGAAPALSVVVTTYAWPQALDAVLRGLAHQRGANMEVVVAEDASTPDTAAVVHRWQSLLPSGRLRHVTQEDEGFRLARVRDLGALAARGTAILFLDGDCVPRRDCARAVLHQLRPGWFLGSKRVRLSRRLTSKVLEHQLPVHRWGFLDFVLRARSDAEGLTGLTPRDRRRPSRARLPSFVPDRAGWGFFLAVRRDDLHRVNGYDARFVGWGGEDVDIATRLGRLGLRGGWAGPASTVLHLWHPDRTLRERPNAPLLAETIASDRVGAVVGLRELAALAQDSANATTGSGASRPSAT